MLKSILVNTALGQVALSLRDRLAILKSNANDLENAGMLANDYIARKLLERLCLPNKVFIDIGAHIGSVIAGVARHSQPRRIIAIEAIPYKAAALRKRFPNAEIVETAVSDAEGEADFTIDLARPGFSSLNPKVATATSASRVIRVKITTLDKVAPHNEVDLIKIDVEGAELGVLRGAEKLVSGSRPVVMFESGVDEMEGFPATELWRWFEQHDYEVSLPMRVPHKCPGLTLDAFQMAHEYPRLTTDYYGIPRERRSEIRLRARAILNYD